ncbi:MAG: prephenate dehydrogenase [Mangrovibacterium sp.]
MIVAIVGLGLIGGSLAIDLRNHHFATNLLGVDAQKGHADKALDLGLVDELCSLNEAAAKADVIILAIPVNQVKKLLPEVLNLIDGTTTVIDLGSTKKSIAETVVQHPRRHNYVAAHPMSGTENSGPQAALPNLFRDKVTIICDDYLSAPQHLALAEKMFQTIGSSIAYTTSDEQDHTTAYISHLPHVVAYALANAALAKESGDIIFDLASGGFNSTVRLAKSAPSMWGPIFQDNKKNVLESIDCYMNHLQELRESIAHDESKMYDLMNNAVSIREVLQGNNSTMIKNEKKIIKLYKR